MTFINTFINLFNQLIWLMDTTIFMNLTLLMILALFLYHYTLLEANKAAMGSKVSHFGLFLGSFTILGFAVLCYGFMAKYLIDLPVSTISFIILAILVHLIRLARRFKSAVENVEENKPA